MFKMNHLISAQDIILQRNSSFSNESYLLGSTFTLQNRTGAIEQSSEEFYEMVSKRSVLHE